MYIVLLYILGYTKYMNVFNRKKVVTSLELKNN